ncbi:tyrosine-type recombinase/integrase [Variovorax sp. 2RAF20]|uniref:tyrosine-type recombinase/integrase n=1 Tax=Variovorax sp. CF313 TaxID=1144315 RepID=UPI000270FAB3|nr:tyrosine-type recombinase/integrase [Variovorax sp. CF313]EJL77131.1 phage integrase family protein [Variovorax sp. CF313]
MHQGKTQTKLRIVVENALEELIEEIRVFKAARPKQSAPLLANERGAPMTAAMLRKRFDKARKSAGIDITTFQFRDLRAKAATDTDESAVECSSHSGPTTNTENSAFFALFFCQSLLTVHARRLFLWLAGPRK